MSELDSTQALLDSTILTPDLVDSVAQDSEEEEVFFGQVSDKEKKKSTKNRRRDTVSLNESVSEWRKLNVRQMSKDSLLSNSSGSNRRSSLLSEENSITEEDSDDDEVFQHTETDHNTANELEIVTGPAINGVNDLTVDISGLEPLQNTLDSEPGRDSIEDVMAPDNNQSVSGIYDSFSEDTAEESLDEHHDANEDHQEQIEMVRRQILQDTTLLSSVSSTGSHICDNNVEIEVTKHAEDDESSDNIPKIIVHDATVTDDTEERSESPDELPASPASQYFTAPSSRRTTDLGRVPSPTFDTTQDEMALFEMFGEDYDEVVAAMTHEERVALGEKLSNRGEEELLEVAKKLRHMMKGRTSSVGSSLPPVIMEEVNQSIGSDVSPFSIASSNNMTPSPNLLPNTVELNLDVKTIEETLNNSHITSPPSKKINLLDTPTVFKSANMSRTEDLVQSPIFSYPNNLSFDEPHVMEMAEATVDNVHSDVNYENVDHTEDNVPAPSPCVTFSNNFMLPTASSLSKMVPQSPSPRKPVHQQQVWLPPSPSPSKLSIGKFVSHSALRSPQSSSKRLPAMSRLPQPIRTPQRQVLGEVTSNSALKTPSGNNVMRTPSSVNKKSATSLKAAYAAVASPVATFVKNNPAPHLVQNVKAKELDTTLESTLVEVDEKENLGSARLSLLPACPLPSAVYKSSSAMDEEQDAEDAAKQDYEYVTEAYGAVTCSAKVTKHVARVKMPNNGLTWSDDLFVNDESVNSSPSVAKLKQPAKSVLKMTRRDSGLFDESMMNVSVVQTKVVKKVARGRGKTRGTSRGVKRK